MSDQQLGKRLMEREDLQLFRVAYELATGETLPAMEDSETPDFMDRDAGGRVLVGSSNLLDLIVKAGSVVKRAM